jgi:hypothetical protein
LLTVLRLAKPSKLKQRTFEAVREGWLVVTKLGKESPCCDFDRTEHRYKSENTKHSKLRFSAALGSGVSDIRFERTTLS